MKILFVGEDWPGSDARGLKDALIEQKTLSLITVGIEKIAPLGRSFLGKALNRLLTSVYTSVLKRRILAKCAEVRPDIIAIVKGWHFDARFIRTLRRRFAPVVNIFPDASPHVHGTRLKKALGEYDLVISMKKYHPPLWKSLYGYSNTCVHVSHGYGSSAHLRNGPRPGPTYDVVMIATARNEYEDLVRKIAPRLMERGYKFALGGHGWKQRGLDRIGITLIGVQEDRAYIDWLRNGKIVIAPVQTKIHSETGLQPGDEVTARTFQCAAGFTFFIHKRTPEVQQYYDENTEVPMYDDASELADKIDFYLAHEDQRLRMAAAAHKRAVPAYSYDARAAEIVHHLRHLIGQTPAVTPSAFRS